MNRIGISIGFPMSTCCEPGTARGRLFVPGLRFTPLLSIALPVAVLLVAFLFQPNLHAQTGSAGGSLAEDLARGQDALKAKDSSAATEAFRAALRVDPANAEAHANLGAIAFVHGDCQAAMPELHSALASAPSLVNAKALIAICEKRLGAENAKADLEAAFAALKDPQLRVQVGVELADVYYQAGDLDHTLPVVHELVELAPDNADLLFFAQRIYSEMADDTLNKLALLAPDSARMQQLIAEKLINAGDLNGAIEHYHKALAADARLPGLHFELAEAILEGGNNAAAQTAARAELDAAVKAEGDNARIECGYGRIAAVQGNFDDALAHYRRAYQLDPSSGEAQLGLGRALEERDQPAEAVKYLRMAVASDPMNPSAHYRLARACRALHLDDEARKETQLYEEIRAAKDHVAQLYRQMNRRPETQDDEPAEGQP
jgi:tetratricopeptide (TPR) repeat protein